MKKEIHNIKRMHDLWLYTLTERIKELQEELKRVSSLSISENKIRDVEDILRINLELYRILK